MIHRLVLIGHSQRSRIILYILRGWPTSLSFFQLQPSSWTPIGGLFSFCYGVTSFHALGRTVEKEHVWIIYTQQEYANWQPGAGNNMQPMFYRINCLSSSLLSFVTAWLTYGCCRTQLFGFNSIQFKGREHKYLSINTWAVLLATQTVQDTS